MSLLRKINPHVKRIQASEQEILYRRAKKINAEIGKDSEKSYKEILDVSSGDSHGMGMKPLTFARQVMAACIYPPLQHDDTLPLDVRERAQRFLEACDGGSIGSYPPTRGIKNAVRSVSEFITRRDGVASNPDHIIIMSGSQNALILMLRLLAHGQGSLPTGVLTPVPCYRSFNKALTAQGAVSVPYYLCEEEGWTMQVEELRRALQAARKHCNPVALYIINPGNPSGHVQSKESIEEVIRFAAEERLFLMADEVYQSMVHGNGSEFYSYRKVLMGSPYSSTVELASVHSASKGIMGECGLRCGYVELVNVDPVVRRYAYVLASAGGSTSVVGQIALDVMADPPQPGQPSYALYAQELQSFRSTIIKNVKRTLEVLNRLPGITCQPIQGGIFAFARLHLSQAAIKHAKDKDLGPDMFYCLRLLEDTGLCASPGSELRQKEGTYHIRLCLAAPVEKMEDALQRLKSFHLRFIKEFP